MWSPRSQRSPQAPSMIMFVLFISFTVRVSATIPKRIEQELVPQEPDTQIKCGTCPCVNPCSQLPPPPPPSPPPPQSPPPKDKYCTPLPPPPPRFIYVTGVPGEIYQTDADNWGFYSKAERNLAKNLLLLGGCVLGVLIIW